MTDQIEKNDNLNLEKDTAETPLNTQPPKGKEEHTAKNTTVRNYVKPVTEIAGEGDPEAPFIPIFLGTGRKQYEKNGKLIELWLEFVSSTSERKENQEPSRIAAAKNNFDEYVKEHYADKTDEEIAEFCNQYFTFTNSFVNPPIFKSKAVRNEQLTNQTQRNQTDVVSDIYGIPPADNRKLELKDLMRRDARRKSGEPENFDVTLKNSFIHLRTKRPDIFQLGRLVQQINKDLKGYARRVNGNSLTLARGVTYRNVFKFMMDLTISCSVKDTDDFNELANNILLKDFDVAACELMAASTPGGVNVQLYCHQDGCQWSGFKLVDPAKMVKCDNSKLTPAQAAAIGNISNYIRKYSREEITELQKQHDFGIDDKIYFDNGQQYLLIKQPTLATYFQTYDQFVNKINPAIQELRARVIDDKQYENEYQTLISSIGGCEYMQWVDELHILPDVNSEEPERIHARSTNPYQFNEGLMDILNDNPDLAKELMRRVYNVSPLMSHTQVGIDNHACPACGKGSGEAHPNNRGITPIDPFMAFFTHTQLMIQKRAMELGLIDLEAQ